MVFKGWLLLPLAQLAAVGGRRLTSAEMSIRKSLPGSLSQAEIVEVFGPTAAGANDGRLPSFPLSSDSWVYTSWFCFQNGYGRSTNPGCLVLCCCHCPGQYGMNNYLLASLTEWTQSQCVGCLWFVLGLLMQLTPARRLACLLPARLVGGDVLGFVPAVDQTKANESIAQVLPPCWGGAWQAFLIVELRVSGCQAEVYGGLFGTSCTV